MTRNIILKTERLLLHETTANEAEDMYNLNNDPEVIKHTGNDGFVSIEKSREFITNYTDYKKYGYGRWTARLKENDEIIGWCGLKFLEDMQEVDIGYRLHKKHWGKGYATEAAKACLEFGKTQLGMKRIIGMAEKKNLASIRIFEKLNMQFEKDFIEDDTDCVFYTTNL